VAGRHREMPDDAKRSGGRVEALYGIRLPDRDLAAERHCYVDRSRAGGEGVKVKRRRRPPSSSGL
jgi:hypothetical protein